MNFRNPFFLLAGFFVGSLLSAQTIQVSGPISSNTTWAADTVQVIGNVTVQPSAKLTIAPGTIVQFQGFFHIEVQGCIQAVGAMGDSIRFTYGDTTGLYNNFIETGGWKGISINYPPAQGDSILFDYCVIEYAKKGLTTYFMGALAFYNANNARVSHSLFQYNIFNTWSGGISCAVSSPKIAHNRFQYNQADYGGGLGIFTQSSPWVEGNVFVYNHALRAGGAIHNQEGAPVIINNILCNNRTSADNCGPADGSGGIRITNNSLAYFANNLVANNTTGMNGGGVQSMYGSAPKIINNTIVNNNAIWYGGGLYCIQSNPTVRNNIIWGNIHLSSFYSNQICLWSDDSDPPMVHNCIEGDTAGIMVTSQTFYSGWYDGNIDQDPQFLNPSTGTGHLFDGFNADWRLPSASPCVDAGTPDSLGSIPNLDLGWNPRFGGNGIDIGAYEFPRELGTTNPSSVSGLLVFPNPARSSIQIIPPAPFHTAIISLFNLTGAKIFSQPFQVGDPLVLNLEAFPAGTYLLEYHSEGQHRIQRIQIQP